MKVCVYVCACVCACVHASPQIMGGTESTLYTGPVWYTPIVEEWYYQVEVLKLEVGNKNLELDCKEVSVEPQ